MRRVKFIEQHAPPDPKTTPGYCDTATCRLTPRPCDCGKDCNHDKRREAEHLARTMGTSVEEAAEHIARWGERVKLHGR